MVSLARETNTQESNTNVDKSTWKCSYFVLECDGTGTGRKERWFGHM